MTNSDKNILQTFYNSIPDNRKFRTRFPKEYPDLFLDIINETCYLPEEATIVQRVITFLEYDNKIPSCPVCGKPLKWSAQASSYSTYCSRRCSAKVNKNAKGSRTTVNRISVILDEVYNDFLKGTISETQYFRKLRKRREHLANLYNIIPNKSLHQVLASDPTLKEIVESKLNPTILCDKGVIQVQLRKNAYKVPKSE